MQRQELLDQLDELEESTGMLTTALAETGMAGVEELDEEGERQTHLGWLERQRVGVLVLLNEAERALLSLGGALEQ